MCYLSQMPKFGIGQRDKQIARMLALGYTTKVVAKRLGMQEVTVKNRFLDADFAKLYDSYVNSIDIKIENEIVQSLVEAELEAVEALRELMVGAKKEDVRLAAAESLLDRAGQRGKPADKSQIATLSLNKPLDESVRNALSDPGVRAYLEQKPELAKMLSAGFPPQTEKVEVVVVEGEVVSDES